LKRLTVGMIYHSARYALVQLVHYGIQRGWTASDRRPTAKTGQWITRNHRLKPAIPGMR